MEICGGKWHHTANILPSISTCVFHTAWHSIKVCVCNFCESALVQWSTFWPWLFHFNFNNLKYIVCKIYTSCVHFKLLMCVQLPSCRSINYWACEQLAYYMEKTGIKCNPLSILEKILKTQNVFHISPHNNSQFRCHCYIWLFVCVWGWGLVKSS